MGPHISVINGEVQMDLDPFDATCLFQLVSERCEKGSILLTSNKSYGDWGQIQADCLDLMLRRQEGSVD